MKIVFFHDKGEIYPLQAGGKERWIINLAKEFVKKRNKVEILTLSANIPREKDYLGIKIKLVNNYSVMRELILSLKQNDIFSFHSSNFLMPAVLHSNAFRLYHVHDIFMGLHNKGRHLDKVISFNWDKIYSPSHFVTNTIKNVYWWCDIDSKIDTIPRGVDISTFYPKSKRKCMEKLSKKLDRRDINKLKHNNPILFFPNRINSKKGENLLFTILERLKIEFPRIKVILLYQPNSSEDNNLKNLIEKHADNIILLDWQNEEDLSCLYSLADITLILSLNPEAFCQVAIESVACGTPVVCTKFGNLRYLSEEIPLIKSSDPEPAKFIERIKEALFLKENTNKSNKSLKIIYDKYNLQKVIPLYIDSFSKLKKEKPNYYSDFSIEKYFFSPFAYTDGNFVCVAIMDNFTRYNISKKEEQIILALQSSKSKTELEREVGFKPDNYLTKLVNKKIIWKV